MSMLFKRIKDWATSITAFRTGDVIPVDGPSGTAKMSKDDLLARTAENALVNNLSPKFDPTKPNDVGGYAYYAGTSVFHEGKNYVFVVNHKSGPWNFSEVEQKPLSSVVDFGSVGEAVNAWLDEHPEATTTVQDNSVTDSKLAPGIKFNRDESVDNKGYVVLKKDMPLVGQVVEENTIYEVRWNYDLDGENVNIPSGCEFFFNGGSIYNGTLTGEFFTTEKFKLENIGIKYNDSSSASLNGDRLKILSGVSNRLEISLTDKVYFYTKEMHFSHFILNGNNNELIFTGSQMGTIPATNGDSSAVAAWHTDGDIIVKNCKIHALDYTRLITQEGGNTSWNNVVFENCEFSGNLRIYNSGKGTKSNSECGVGFFIFKQNYVHDIYESGYGHCICLANNCAIHNILIDNNEFYKFSSTPFYFALENGSAQETYIKTIMHDFKLCVSNNNAHNDDGYDAAVDWSGGSSGYSGVPGYYCFILSEGGEAWFYGNKFINIIANNSEVAVYSQYISSDYLVFDSNIWRNCINLADNSSTRVSNHLNEILKSKGGGGNRKFSKNLFILDDVSALYENVSNVSLYLINPMSGIDEVCVDNNNFDLWCYTPIQSTLQYKKILFRNNRVIIHSIIENGSFLMCPRTVDGKEIIDFGGNIFEGKDEVNRMTLMYVANDYSGVVKVYNNKVDGIFSPFALFTMSNMSEKSEICDNIFSIKRQDYYFGLFALGGSKALINNRNVFLISDDGLYNQEVYFFLSPVPGMNAGLKVKGLNKTSGNYNNCRIFPYDTSTAVPIGKVMWTLDFTIDNGKTFRFEYYVDCNSDRSVITASYFNESGAYIDAEAVGNRNDLYNEYNGGAFRLSVKRNAMILQTSDWSSYGNFDLKISGKIVTSPTFTNIPTKGTTSARNTFTSSILKAGYVFFDTTLGKYIVWNGSAWVNMDGTAL